MTNTYTPADLAEVDRLMQIASGELILVRGIYRDEATGREAPVEFYLPAERAPKLREAA